MTLKKHSNENTTRDADLLMKLRPRSGSKCRWSIYPRCSLVRQGVTTIQQSGQPLAPPSDPCRYPFV